MKNIRLFIYALVLGFVALGYWYFEVRLPGQDQSAGEEARKVFHFDPEAVTGLRVGAVELGMTDGEWRVIDPVDEPADQAAVDDLLDVLARLSVERSLGEVDDITSFGLGDDALSLVFRVGADEYGLELGGVSPMRTFAYARKKGSAEVFLVKAYERGGLERSLFDLREKRLFSLQPNQVNQLSIKRDGIIMDLVRDDAGLWRLLDRDDLLISQDRVGQVLARLSWTEARAFLDGEVPLNEPEIVCLLGDGQREERLSVWKSLDEQGRIRAYSSVRAREVGIDPRLRDVFPVSVEDLADRRLLRFDPPQVTLVRYTEGGEAHQIERRDGEWYRDGEKLKEGWRVDGLLDALGSIEYEEEFLQLPGESEQTGRIEVGLGTKTLYINFYSNYYAAAPDGYFRVGEDIMKRVLDSAEMLFQLEGRAL